MYLWECKTNADNTTISKTSENNLVPRVIDPFDRFFIHSDTNDCFDVEMSNDVPWKDVQYYSFNFKIMVNSK